MIIAPKFFENFDNKHCLQASVLMCANSLGREMGFDEIDKLTGYNESLYSWMITAVSELQKMFPGVKFFSNLDYKKISVDAEAYLKRKWINDLGHYKDQESHALPGFRNIQSSSKSFFNNGGVYKKLSKKSTQLQLSKALENNLVIMWVNWYKLYGQPGHKGHFVVVFAETDNHFVIHDSGQPPHLAKKVGKSKLLEAGGAEFALVPKKGSPIGKIINMEDICYCNSGKFFKNCHMEVLKQKDKTMFV